MAESCRIEDPKYRYLLPQTGTPCAQGWSQLTQGILDADALSMNREAGFVYEPGGRTDRFHPCNCLHDPLSPLRSGPLADLIAPSNGPAI